MTKTNEAKSFELLKIERRIAEKLSSVYSIYLCNCKAPFDKKNIPSFFYYSSAEIKPKSE